MNFAVVLEAETFSFLKNKYCVNQIIVREKRYLQLSKQWFQTVGPTGNQLALYIQAVRAVRDQRIYIMLGRELYIDIADRDANKIMHQTTGRHWLIITVGVTQLT